MTSSSSKHTLLEENKWLHITVEVKILNTSSATCLRNVSTRGYDRDFMVKLWRPSKALLLCVTSFEDYEDEVLLNKF